MKHLSLISFLLILHILSYGQNVGINTNLPQAQLHIIGDSVIMESQQFANRLVFSFEEFSHIIKALTDISIEVDSSKKILLNPNEPDAQVIVGSSNASNNAILSISSDNKGILIPKITQDSIDAMALSMDDDGLLLYNADQNIFQVYNSGTWQDIGQSKWQNGNYANSINYNGNVGINRSSPQTTLDVTGDATIRGRLDFRSTSGFSSNFGIVDNGTDFYVGPIRNESSMFVQADKDLIFRTDSLGFGERMRLIRNGNLGIGLSNPTEKLEVGGNIAQRGDRFDIKATSGSNNDFSIVRGGSDFYLGATKSGADLFVQADKELRFRTKDTTYKERMVIKNNGFVGIGTDNPEGHLHTVGNIIVDNANNGGAILFDNGNNVDGLILMNQSPDNEQEFFFGGVLPNTDVRIGATDSIKFNTGSGNFSVITDQGDMGIGTLNPLQKLDVKGAIAIGEATTPSEGAIQYNATTDDFEGYDGTVWKSLTENVDADADPTNELQLLTDESDPGSTVQIGIAVPGNPVQDIDLTNAITNLPGYINDGDNDDQNELQQLSINGNVLSITGGNNVTIPNSGGGGSSLWTDNGSQDIYYSAGKVGIGTPTPISDLHVSRSTNLNAGDNLLKLEASSGASSLSNLIEAKRGSTSEFSVKGNGDTHIGGNLDINSSTHNWGKVTGYSSSTQFGSISYGKFYIDDGSSTVDYPSIELLARNESGVNPTDKTSFILRPSGNVSDTAFSMVWTRGLSANSASASFNLYNTNLNQKVVVLKENVGGEIELYDNDTRTIKIDGQSSNGTNTSGSAITLYNAETDPRVLIKANSIGNGANIELDGLGASATSQGNVIIDANGSSSQGGQIVLKSFNNTTSVEIEANDNSSRGGSIKLFNLNGDNTIKLETNWNGTGDSRIVTAELQIDGGSDFAEHFDIIEEETLAPIPGMVVSIDPASTGKLEVTKTAYDRKVAGIISGANGVETGLMMGQKGSIADGDYPIALTGRVYVYANNEGGEIKPGDLLTTSSRAGYAMKVTDYSKAQGAIIGKAMTTIDENGFVLVLVNLQ